MFDIEHIEELGWSVNNHPTSKLIVTNRRKVSLKKHNFTILFNKSNCCVPFYMKSKNGDAFGLTSGAGSSVIRFDNNFRNSGR